MRARDPAALSDARDATRTVVRARTLHETRRDIARERSARSRRERGGAREERRAEVVGARVNLCRGDSSLKLVVVVTRKAASCAARAHGV